MTNPEFFGKLWNACNNLRGRFDPSEYKYVILTIIFLKFASDAYEKNIEQLKSEGISEEDYKDELKEKKVILVPDGCHWKDIIKKSKTSEIHIFIDEVLQEFEKANSKNLTGLWKRFAEKFTKDPSQLSKIILEFSNFNFGNTIEENRDLLGNAYEYFLKQFGEASGKKAGEFYTPKTIVELMVEILVKNINDNDEEIIRIYDPTAGSGGMFVQSAKLINNKTLSFFGQEINDNTYVLAKMNLAIRGLIFDLGDEPHDTLRNDLHKKHNGEFDMVIANPPFNLKVSKKELENIDSERWAKYGVPSESKGNYFFLEHMIHKMNEKGIMAVLLDNGSQTSNATKHIREAILKDDLYEAIIELPSNIFYGTSIAASLYILNKNKINSKGKVLFIDAKDNFEKRGIINELSKANIDKVIKVYNDFRKGKDIDLKNFAISKTNQKVIENFSNLSPRQYISHDEVEVNYEKEYKEAINELKFNIEDIKKDFDELLTLIDKNKDY